MVQFRNRQVPSDRRNIAVAENGKFYYTGSCACDWLGLVMPVMTFTPYAQFARNEQEADIRAYVNSGY